MKKNIYVVFVFASLFTDIFPLGDIALITTIKELTKVKTKSEIVRLTQK